MVLLLDLGNTNLFIGIYQNGSLMKTYRTYADKNKSSDQYAEIMQIFFLQAKLDINAFEGAILSSVIPSLTSTLALAVESVIHKKCFIVGKSLKTGLPIRTDNPLEVGHDLVCDSVGATYKYGYPIIIADLGTATKILVVDKNGAFIGCSIAPGIKLSMNALSNNAAQLMDVSLVAPNKVIGKNSPDSINSGIVYGTICMIEGMCQKIEEELGYPVKKVVCGGYSSLIKNHLNASFIYDANLILEGLYQIYLKNRDL
jgi:type III pantothenate kinase